MSSERGGLDFNGFGGTYAERIGPPDPLDAAIGRAVICYFELAREVRNGAERLGLAPAAPWGAESALLHQVSRLESGLREALQTGAMRRPSWDVEAWLDLFVADAALIDTLIMAIVEDASFPPPVTEGQLARSARLIRGRDIPEWPLLPSEIIDLHDFVSSTIMDLEFTISDLVALSGD